MRLIDNWRRVLTHAWSARCIYAAIAADRAIELLPYVGDYLPRWAVLAVMVAALAGRVIHQPTVSGDA